MSASTVNTRPERSVSDLLASPDVNAIVLATSKDPNAKITVLVVSPTSGVPTLAIKVPTTTVSAEAVAAEALVLEALHGLVPPNLASTIPSTLALLDSGEHSALVMQALPGRPMSAHYHDWGHTSRPSRVARDFILAGNWLAHLQTMTDQGLSGLDMSLEGTLLDRLRSRFSDDPEIVTIGLAVSSALERMIRVSTPKTVVHGDFWVGNLLTTHNEITGVVDWEHGASCGEPTRDVIRFALTYALYLDRHTVPGRRVHGHRRLRAAAWGSGIPYAVEGRGWFPDLFRNFIRDHLERLGAPGSTWHDAVLAGLAEIAVTSDDPEFACRHLGALGGLCRRGTSR